MQQKRKIDSVAISSVAALLLVAAGRMHGIGGIPAGRIIAKLIVGVCAGIAWVVITGCPSAFLLGGIAAWAFTWGHGNFYAMDGAKDGITDSEPEKLESIVRPIFVKLGGDIYKPSYSWWCMGFKWLFIGGPPLALFAPAAYTVSFCYTESSALAEWLTTIFCAMLFFPLVAFWQYEVFFIWCATYLFR